MTTITITFTDDARVGRRHGVAPLVLDMPELHWLDVAEAVHEYVQPFLLSSDISVRIAADQHRGVVFCGFQTGARFDVTVSEVPA